VSVRALRTLAWTAVVLLVLIGVTSSVARAVFVDDLVARAEPLRARIMAAVGLDDPLAAERAQIGVRIDGRFGAHRTATYLHVVLGAAFLLFAPLQLSARVRNRHRALHRWSGRGLVLTGVIMAVSGLYFGLFIPYAGAAERIVVGTFGALFLAALSIAFVAIRHGEVARHRRWMIRAFAIALGIATVRVAAAALDLTLAPAGVATETIFVLSLWIGWGTTLGAAELWLGFTDGAA
jgi:uncharacterized membrane protein